MPLIDLSDPRSLQILRDLMLFGPIGLLWGVGLWITLGSGVGSDAHRGPWRRLSATASLVALRLAAWLVGMVLILEAVGFRVLPW